MVREKLLHSIRNYCLVLCFLTLNVRDKVKTSAEMQFTRNRLLISIARLVIMASSCGDMH